MKEGSKFFDISVSAGERTGEGLCLTILLLYGL